MKLKIYAIRDAKTEAYMRPFFLQAHGQALRAFTDSCSDPRNENIYRYPEDYALFYLGDFDDVNGMLEPVLQPVHLGNATEYKRSFPDESRALADSLVNQVANQS